jgi:uncharacterized glyoxalase superfamily protein PhnB
MKQSSTPPLKNRSMPPGVFIPVLPYSDVAEAVKWLCEAFGFAERLRIGNHRAQLIFNGASMVVTDAAQHVSPGQSVMVRAENIDPHFERARQRGAKVILPPSDHPYGERQYTAEDFAGYRWTFSQSVADVDPKEWGGVLLAGN